jgi:hypothetical protein
MLRVRLGIDADAAAVGRDRAARAGLVCHDGVLSRPARGELEAHSEATGEGERGQAGPERPLASVCMRVASICEHLR